VAALATLGTLLIYVSLIGLLYYHVVSAPNDDPWLFLAFVASLLVATTLLTLLVALGLHRAHSSGFTTEAERERAHLDATVNNIPIGLAMFDAGHRLILCNPRFAEIYGLSPDQVAPGTPLAQIVEHRMRTGQLLTDKTAQEIADDLVRARDSGALEAIEMSLQDGRCIAMTVRSMPDGGTVTTHQDITEQRRSEVKIAHMALHDALSGLPNRLVLTERLDHALARTRRGEIVAVHMINLDRFKAVNDALGHEAGDKVLKLVSARLRSIVREEDTVARLGGDEFAIIQVATAQRADVTALAQRLIDALSQPYEIDGQQAIVGASVGISVGPLDGTTPDQLLRRADLALHRAKREGRGTCHFFERSMDAQMQERRAIEYDLRRALPRGDLELYYQPVVDAGTGRLRGVEALVHWQHQERGMVLPDKFIPLAEDIGFIVPLGEWAIRTACAAAVSWPADLYVAVNLSPAQFRAPNLVNVVQRALAETGLPAHRLAFEITESVLFEDSPATLAMLHELRALGVRMAVDDFGTGYSSLSYLQKYPFDKIKIDRSFVQAITDGAGSLNIIRAVTAMAKGLGMETTAEGIETEAQLNAVRAEGCTEVQGYLVSKPLPASDVMEFCRTHASAGAVMPPRRTSESASSAEQERRRWHIALAQSRDDKSTRG
jgi:diguanylate cyclase (GGDEF)-like protein